MFVCPFPTDPKFRKIWIAFFFFILKFAFLNKIIEIKFSKFIVTVPKVYSGGLGTDDIMMCLPHSISTRLFDVTYLKTENHDLYCISNNFFNIQIKKKKKKKKKNTLPADPPNILAKRANKP